MKHSWKFAATTFSAAALLGGLHGAAHADLFTITNNYSLANTVSVTNNGVTGSYEVGRYFATVNSGPVINVFCIDVSNDISPPATYVTDDSEATVFSAGPVAQTLAPGSPGYYYTGGLVSALTPNDYKPNLGAGTLNIQNRAYAADYLAGTYLTGPTLSSTNYTAIQLAIWDIVQDGGDGLSAGNFLADNSYSSLVSTYESDALAHDTRHTGLTDWIQAPRPDGSVASESNHVQEFVGLPGDLHPTGNPVPEPGPLAMVASLGLAVGGLMLKRLRVRPTA